MPPDVDNESAGAGASPRKSAATRTKPAGLALKELQAFAFQAEQKAEEGEGTTLKRRRPSGTFNNCHKAVGEIDTASRVPTIHALDATTSKDLRGDHERVVFSAQARRATVARLQHIIWEDEKALREQLRSKKEASAKATAAARAHSSLGGNCKIQANGRPGPQCRRWSTPLLAPSRQPDGERPRVAEICAAIDRTTQDMYAVANDGGGTRSPVPRAPAAPHPNKWASALDGISDLAASLFGATHHTPQHTTQHTAPHPGELWGNL